MRSVAELIADLDGPSGDAEDARAELTARGVEVMPELLAALPRLGRLGKLLTIEAVEDLAYAGAGPALVPLLRDEHDTVREWAAGALGRLGHTPAVPEIVALRRRMVADGERVDWTGPVTVRHALTELGHRHPVVPPLLAETVEDGRWPAAILERLLDALAEADQVVLYFMLWRHHERFRLVGASHTRVGWEYDPAAAWCDNVRDAHEAALLEASDLPAERGDLVVDLEWIDVADVR